eukprot:3389332-Prymnesium_polylepis.1
MEPRPLAVLLVLASCVAQSDALRVGWCSGAPSLSSGAHALQVRTPCCRCAAPRAGPDRPDDDEERRVRMKVYGLAEMESPLRTARLLFLYPVALVYALGVWLNCNIVIARAVFVGDDSRISAAASTLAFSLGLAAAT